MPIASTREWPLFDDGVSCVLPRSAHGSYMWQDFFTHGKRKNAVPVMRHTFTNVIRICATVLLNRTSSESMFTPRMP